MRLNINDQNLKDTTKNILRHDVQCTQRVRTEGPNLRILIVYIYFYNMRGPRIIVYDNMIYIFL